LEKKSQSQVKHRFQVESNHPKETSAAGSGVQNQKKELEGLVTNDREEVDECME